MCVHLIELRRLKRLKDFMSHNQLRSYRDRVKRKSVYGSGPNWLAQQDSNGE